MSGLDGLDALVQQRNAAKRPARAKRAMPPARHPRTTNSPDEVAPESAMPTQAPQDSPPETTASAVDHQAQPATTAMSPEPQAVTSTPTTHLASSHSLTDSTSTTETEAVSLAARDLTPAPTQEAPDRPGTTASAATSRMTERDSSDERGQPAKPLEEQARVTKVRPLTISLDEDDIDFLDELRILGMQSRPKIDIGRSAVLRLALRRLRLDVTPEEIRDDMATRAAQSPATPGRRRL